MAHDPLSPDALRAASQRIHDAHMAAIRAHDGDTFHVRRAMWDKASHGGAIGAAMLCLVAASGTVRIIDPATGHCENMTALGAWGAASPTPGKENGNRHVLDCHDPLSGAKMAAAAETFASAVMRAEANTDRNPEAARRLVWNWARRDPELRTAMLRLGTCENGPDVTVIMPDASSPVAQPGGERLH